MTRRKRKPSARTMRKLAKHRRRILARDHHRCRYCGRSLEYLTVHIDHVVPRSHGGKAGGRSLPNLVASCDTCNLAKGADTWTPIPLELMQHQSHLDAI